MRLLAPRRLSRKTDESVSIETQTIGIDEWAAANGHTIVQATEDLDVSGGTYIRDRPEIGPWLTPEHLDEWDGLVLYKIDRGFRNHYDFVTFVHDFCEPHGKVIISVGEGIDTSTSMGKFILGMLVQFAEWELTRMKERRSDAAKRFRSDARWNGGSIAFGYRPQQREHGDGFDLVPAIEPWTFRDRNYPATALIAREMAEAAINLTSALKIASSLEARGIPTPQDGFRLKNGEQRQGRWRQTTVLAILRNPALRGYVTQTMPSGKGKRYTEPKIIRNEDGTPVRRDPVLDDKTWYRLQAALDSMSKQRTRARSNAHPLLGVAFCGKVDEAGKLCGAPLYALRQANARWSYYVCSARQQGRCGARGIPMPDLDARIETEMTAAYSKIPFPEKVVTPGIDHAAELAVIDGQIAELDQAHKDGDLHTRAYSRQVSELETIREALEAEQQPGEVEYEDADDTVAERFLAADLEGRRRIMLYLNIRITALLISKGNIAVSLQVKI
jgi:DNA invertase Pin-like site-specific DNA recombinase